VQWVYSIFGLVTILIGSLGLLMLRESKSEHWWIKIYAVLFTIGFMAIGAWLAWPILVGSKDLLFGTHEASAIVRARAAANASAIHSEWLTAQTTMETLAVLLGGLSPLLFWQMRRHDPDSRRHWVVLAVGLIAGYLVLVHRAYVVLPGSLSAGWVEPLRQTLTRHETLLFFGLYWEFFWLTSLAATSLSGLSIGSWSAFLLPCALLPYWVGYYLEYPFWKLLLCWLSAVALGAIFNGIRKLEDEAETAKRAERARRASYLLLKTDESHRPHFALYLRPFSSTGNLDAQGTSEEADPLDLESVLSYAVRPELMLLGLNRIQEKSIVGAGYVYGPDEDWFARFKTLASNARLLFLLPSTQKGTLEEVEWVFANQALEKCVFIMPETITGRGWQSSVSAPTTVKVYEQRFIDHAPEWEMTRAAVFERTRVSLPDYREAGAVFTLNSRGGLRRLEPLGLSRSLLKVLRLRKQIKRVMQPAIDADWTGVRAG
jgi:hypothetical protein